MEVAVERRALARVLMLASRAVTPRAGQGVLDHIELLVGAGEVRATGSGSNGTIRAAAQIAGLNGDAKRLLIPSWVAEVVNSLKGENVSLSEEGPHLVVRATYTTVRVPTIGKLASTYPAIEPPDGVWHGVSQRRIKAVAERIVPFTYKASDRPVMAAVALSEDGWGACNGYQAATLAQPGLVEPGRDPVLVPTKALQEAAYLSGKDGVEVAIGQYTISFATDNEVVSASRIDGQQIEWRNVIRNADEWAILDCDAIHSAVRRMIATGPMFEMAGGRHHTGFLIFRQGAVTVVSLNPAGYSSERVPCTYTGPDQVVKLSLDFLLAMIDAAGKIVRLGPQIDPNTPLAVRGEGDDWRATMFPMRLKDQEIADVTKALG